MLKIVIRPPVEKKYVLTEDERGQHYFEMETQPDDCIISISSIKSHDAVDEFIATFKLLIVGEVVGYSIADD